MAPKKPVDKHSFVQVFAGKEDTLQDSIIALFDLMNRPGIAFSTPGERARFNAARDVIQKADISVDASKVEIIANAADARKVAEALAVPNANGKMEIPDVNDVLDAEKLPGLILARAMFQDTYKKTMDNVLALNKGKIKELEANDAKRAAELTDLSRKAQEATRTANKLLEEKQELEAQNSALTEQNKTLYNQANYVTKRGRVTPAKKANRITTAILCVTLVAVAGLSALGFKLGADNKSLTSKNDQLKVENSVAAEQIIDLEDQLGVAHDQNILLGLENQELKEQIEVLTEELEDVKEDLKDLNDLIESNQKRYENIVDKAQQAGVMVADDVKIEDLFDAIMASTENGTSEDVKKVYIHLLQCMSDYGITKGQITDANGNYTSDKINNEVRHIFENAVVNAQILANNEAIIIESLEGTGKERSDFATQTEALNFVIAHNEKEIEELEAAVEAKENIINEKDNELDDLRDTIDQLEDTIVDLENSNTGTDNSALIQNLRNTVSRLESELSATEAELNTTKAELNTTKSALSTAISNQEASDRDAAAARQEAANAYAQAAAARQDAAAARQEADEARQEAEEAEAEANGANAEAAAARQEAANARAAEAEARAEEAEAEARAAEAEAKAAEAERAKNAAIQAYQELLDQITNQPGSSTQTPSEQPSTDNNSGNVNVGDVDKDDENVNPGQGDKGEVNTPGEELGDD